MLAGFAGEQTEVQMREIPRWQAMRHTPIREGVLAWVSQENGHERLARSGSHLLVLVPAAIVALCNVSCRCLRVRL